VRLGDNIQVVDRATGEDITAVTLSQVVLDNERKKHGGIPESVLQQLRGPGDAIRGAVGQAISAGEDFIQRVEERVVRTPEMALEEALERTLKRLKIPTQRDFSRIDRQLRDLQGKVDALSRRTSRTNRRSKA
jgi:polyhydroxyalkanoate synthesis regulator protein